MYNKNKKQLALDHCDEKSHNGEWSDYNSFIAGYDARQHTIDSLTSLSIGYINQINSLKEKINQLENKLKESLIIPDIRNKLSPICNLISLIEYESKNKEFNQLIKDEINNSKKSVNYLSNKIIYK